ncbi:hypothetical protein HS5_05940 [Acidianus sp. HS-5]|nr:hypothetical protein HS5_05940 [Acidianus sp. HS-5]
MNNKQCGNDSTRVSQTLKANGKLECNVPNFVDRNRIQYCYMYCVTEPLRYKYKNPKEKRKLWRS